MYSNTILYTTSIILLLSCKVKKQEIIQFEETKSDTSAIKNNVPSQKDTPKAVTSSEVVLDSLLFDFNNNQIIDKVLIRANPKEKDTMGMNILIILIHIIEL